MKFDTGYSSADGPRELPTEEIHDANVAFIWDCGMQPGYKDKPPTRKVVVCFELAECDSKGRPFIACKEETASLYRKDGSKASNLRKLAELLRPDADNSPEGVNAAGGTVVFHGLPCRVNIEHRGGHAKVAGVMKPSATGKNRSLVREYTEDRPLGLAKWMVAAAMTPEQVEAAKARLAAKQTTDAGGAGDDLPNF